MTESPGRMHAFLADRRGLDELVGLVALVSGAHRLDAAVGVVLGTPVHEHVVGLLGALPALVAIHRPIAPDDGAHARAAALLAPLLHLLEKAGARVGQRVAPVGEGVHHDVVGGLRRHRDQRLEVVPPGVHAAVGDEADEVHARRVLHGGPQDVVVGERPVLDGLADAREVLLDRRAGAEVEVSDLRVAHLALGQADRRAPRRQLAVRIALPEVVEDRRRRQRDGVARAVRRDPPAVEDDEADRRDGHPRAASTIAAKSATSREAPPTSAPSTSGRASSSAALSGLTEPP